MGLLKGNDWHMMSSKKSDLLPIRGQRTVSEVRTYGCRDDMRGRDKDNVSIKNSKIFATSTSTETPPSKLYLYLPRHVHNVLAKPSQYVADIQLVGQSLVGSARRDACRPTSSENLRK